MTHGPTGPLRFLLVLHNHQPLGNFDEVVHALTEKAYWPFLEAIRSRPSLKLTLHISGPLLMWMESRAHRYLDLVGDLVQRGQVELLLGGLYEPILSAIPHDDRVAQITLMAERLKARFGARPRGLWLTERAWDGAILPSLADAKVAYVFMDDRAFLSSGFSDDRLHDYYVTEADGRPIAVFPIDKALRYLIPFRPATEIEGHLRWIARAGGRLAIAADDGEKFGGWPGTFKWVYEDGWLKAFLDLLEGAADWLVLQTAGEALETLHPAGLCYLPTSSYMEMEEWALGPDGGRAFEELRNRVGPDADRFAPYIRGGHWKHFLVRYPEANRAHKKGLALGRLLPRGRRTDPAHDELLAAQCNDAYWHGVFGGLYLPHLRHEIWRRLARAEAMIRRGQALEVEALDLDCDGSPEVWVHGHSFSAQVQPHRGGRLVEWTDFAGEVNVLNTLTRRRELYHDALKRASEHPGAGNDAGIQGIHHLQREAPADLAEALTYDRWERASFLDHFFAEPDPVASWASGRLDERGDFADGAWGWKQTPRGVVLDRSGHVRSDAEQGHAVRLEKAYTFTEERSLTVRYRILNQERGPLRLCFGVELNFFLLGLAFGRSLVTFGKRDVSLDQPIAAADVKRFTLSALDMPERLTVILDRPAMLHGHLVATLSQSEQGYERTVQGAAMMPCWSLALEPGHEWTGAITVRID